MAEDSLNFNYLDWISSFFNNKNQHLSENVTTTNTNQNPIVVQPFRRLQYKHFQIIYSTYHKIPLAVYQRINKEIIEGNAHRIQFFTDQNLQKKFASTNDHFKQSSAFKNFRLARGHMAAAGNYGKQEDKNQTFTFANIIPQHQNNNSGIWNTFERYSRELLIRNICQSVQIISGPIFTKTTPYNKSINQTQKQISSQDNVFFQKSVVLGDNGITVPDKLYKIIKCNQKDKAYASGFTFFNSKTDSNKEKLSYFQTPISQIQEKTGLIFNLVPKNTKLQSLVKVDQLELNKTKLQKDRKYFELSLKKSQSFDQFVRYFWRAKDQQLKLQSKDFLQQIKLLLIKEIMLKAQQKPCSYLQSLLNLNKKLCQINLINQFQDTISNIQKEVIRQCVKTATESDKISLKKLLSTKRWYKYVNQQLLINYFNIQKNDVQSENSDTTSNIKLQQQKI